MATVAPPFRIIHWTSWFGSPMFDGQDKPMGFDCPPPSDLDFNLTDSESWCTITTSHDAPEKAAAIAFHAADYSAFSAPPKREQQPWILHTMESPETALFRTSEQSMEEFDFLASYHSKSRFFFPYFSPSAMDVANRPLPSEFMKSKKKGAPILWVAKNCMATSGRQKYIEELMKYIRVDSYGDCLHNIDFPPDKSREQLMSEYKFYLAVENANCDEYVTEKLADTLANSAVPIADGPPSYKGYIPTSRSIIRMDAYPDPRELAAYINYLDNNDEAYLEYLSHRRDAISIAAKDRLDPDFIYNWGDTTFHNQRTSWCSICRGTASWWRLQHDSAFNHSISEFRGSHLRIDNSCSASGKWDYAKNGPPYLPSWTPSPKDEVAHMSAASHSAVTVDSVRKLWLFELAICVAFVAFISFIAYRMNRRKLASVLP